MLLNKKIYALVPARGGSKGIKFKNLKKINNQTLVEITSKFIDNCKIFDEKILSSDHDKILKLGKKLKFKNVTRNKYLGGDNISDFKIIFHSLKKLNIKDGYLVYLQPTSPIRKKHHLIETLKKVINLNFHSSWSVSRVSKKYHPFKILIEKKKNLLLFDHSGKKFISRQLLADIFIRNGVFYIFSIKKLLQKKTIYLDKILKSETKYKISNIDDYKDLREARKLMKTK